MRLYDGRTLGRRKWQSSQYIHIPLGKEPAEMKRTAAVRRRSLFKHQLHQMVPQVARAGHGNNIFSAADHHGQQAQNTDGLIDQIGHSSGIRHLAIKRGRQSVEETLRIEERPYRVLGVACES